MVSTGRIWKYSWLDSFHCALSIMQFTLTLIVASHWSTFSLGGKVGTFILIFLMMLYNIIVISHLFTHTHWFKSNFLNGLVSMLNSINIGQSVMAYQLTHVRNHHRYNNDQKHSDGKTKDTSSTYQHGKDHEHASLFRYAFVGAFYSLVKGFFMRDLLSVFRLWRVNDNEHELLDLMATSVQRRKAERLQLRLDRMALFLGICLFLWISWSWTLS